MLIWRGGFTGIVNDGYFEYKMRNNKSIKFKYLSRLDFVNKFYNKYDVKLINSDCGFDKNKLFTTQNTSGFLNIDYMANNYKFQIALNGNSFAGSFGWNLLSESVVFHPDFGDNFFTYINPRKNIDYIPINENYSDLDGPTRLMEKTCQLYFVQMTPRNSKFTWIHSGPG